MNICYLVLINFNCLNICMTVLKKLELYLFHAKPFRSVRGRNRLLLLKFPIKNWDKFSMIYTTTPFSKVNRFGHTERHLFTIQWRSTSRIWLYFNCIHLFVVNLRHLYFCKYLYLLLTMISITCIWKAASWMTLKAVDVTLSRPVSSHSTNAV